ncbi:voltage-dependent anion channel-domain-containing protein [Boeremia exigua]|uniref:voltage-dependent anion channel-domain-containing protein n=1 Tax=Boeremia exigua TaxID=749465 RepID=UPI001E8EBCBD|nr:voltage-dependent anion channel-domain-containing protein [Boeremia exigua]KAH6618504.1 voltage-dependent anion channel-domain-containing protein [Boeremia exigua]
MAHKRREHDYDFEVPWRLIDGEIAHALDDDADSEQHKRRRNQKLRKRSIRHYRHATGKWGAALESFKPIWFASAISTGGLALILAAPFPYSAPWQLRLSSVLFVFEIVLFALFCVLTLARWIVFPHVAVRRALSDPDELCSYAIPPIVLMTISALTATQVSTTEWGGHAFTLVAYVLWWIGMFWMFLTGVVVIVTCIYTGNQMDRTMTPVLFMAPVGLATAGVEAGNIVNNGAEMTARLAMPMIVVGYFVVGIALFMGLILYTLFFHRLLAAGLNPPAQRAGLFILVGAAGQLSSAFQILGKAARTYFQQYKPQATDAIFWNEQTGAGIDFSSLLFGLLFLGFDYFTLCLAVVGVIDVFVKKQFAYTLSWWSAVFPTITLVTAWLQLGNTMDSPAFRGLTAASYMCVVVLYVLNWVGTIRGIYTGDLIWAKSELHREEGMMKKAKDMQNMKETKEV